MNILYLTFYYEPDLCAGSFRNTPIIKELSKQLKDNGKVHVVTTMPNRYSTYKVEASTFEKVSENLKIERVEVPLHNSDFLGQFKTFTKFFFGTLKKTKNNDYDLVVASSSRLFTAFLGAFIARKKKLPLYLDIRDIFKETIIDIFKNKFITSFLKPVLTFIENYTFGYATHINLVSQGFESYFYKYQKAKYSYFTNGIDEDFENLDSSTSKDSSSKIILYAGNIGEGQGLDTIIPETAKRLGNKYKFQIIGDGGTKQKLVNEIVNLGNVEIINPMNRVELKKYYLNSDYLFLHLNDYEAFKRVLPSKIFEYAAYDKPIIAGVGGYAATFIEENVENSIIFEPKNVDKLVQELEKYQYHNYFRTSFKNKYKRENIVKKIVASILVVAK